MTYEERTAKISAWLTRFLARKSTPRRLGDETAATDEMRAMVKALNRHTPSDANGEQLAHWLERTEGFLDEADIPSWPSVGEMVKHFKRVLPAVAPVGPAQSVEDETEARGEKLAQEWLRSPASRAHFEDGSHVNAAQWIRRHGALPDARQAAAIRASAADISDFIADMSAQDSSRDMKFALLKTAGTLIAKRIAAYESGRRFHTCLPETPPWLDAVSAALEQERDTQLGAVTKKIA